MALAPFISAISLAFLAFLAVLLLADKHRTHGTPYLAALLTILALVISLRLSFDLASPLMIYLPFVVFPAALVYAPCIYLYTQAVLFDRHARLRLKVGLTVVMVSELLLHAYLHHTHAEMRDGASIIRQAGVVALYTRCLVTFGAVFSLVFILLAWRNVRAYEKLYSENFAGGDREQTRWLKTLIYLNIFLIGSFFMGSLFILLLDLSIPTTPIEGIVALSVICVILFYFVKKPTVFSLPHTAAVEKPIHESAKYKKQNLSASERKAYLEKIENYVTEEKPFLDDKVTLASLARELAIPPHHFSMVINIERNMNFYHFINYYRVAEAKLLLNDAALAHENVLEIALMAGFQSKAGFNKTFKDITGQTPSEFRARS